MTNVIEIHRKRTFTLDEARALLPVVRRVTTSAFEEVKTLGTQLSYLNGREKKTEVEEKVRTVIREWYEKVRRLGCESKGMWLVDFDSGDGYYCWHFPEEDILFFHGYDVGFQGRERLQ
jgi:hypothetical protein